MPINSGSQLADAEPHDHRPGSATEAAPDAAIPFEMIELLFFAYRDFISGPDLLLSDMGLGRAHHRVLHFVNRNPGICVADLLDILKITKQSLARVLKRLIASGFITQRPGSLDRRKRHLFATNKGKTLALRLARLQADRINAALAPMSGDDLDTIRNFLFTIIEASEREAVCVLTRSPRPDPGLDPPSQS